jgi:hypothetical protein
MDQIFEQDGLKFKCIGIYKDEDEDVDRLIFLVKMIPYLTYNGTFNEWMTFYLSTGTGGASIKGDIINFNGWFTSDVNDLCGKFLQIPYFKELTGITNDDKIIQEIFSLCDEWMYKCGSIVNLTTIVKHFFHLNPRNEQETIDYLLDYYNNFIKTDITLSREAIEKLNYNSKIVSGRFPLDIDSQKYCNKEFITVSTKIKKFMELHPNIYDNVSVVETPKLIIKIGANTIWGIPLNYKRIMNSEINKEWDDIRNKYNKKIANIDEKELKEKVNIPRVGNVSKKTFIDRLTLMINDVSYSENIAINDIRNIIYIILLNIQYTLKIDKIKKELEKEENELVYILENMSEEILDDKSYEEIEERLKEIDIKKSVISHTKSLF